MNNVLVYLVIGAAAAALFTWPTFDLMTAVWLVAWPLMVLILLMETIGFSLTVLLVFFFAAAAGIAMRRRPLTIVRRGHEPRR